MTKSEDLDPWLGGEGEEKPIAEKKPRAKKVKDDGDISPVIERGDDSPVDDAPEAVAEASESNPEFVPTDVPTIGRTPVFEPYTASRGRSETTFTRKSEATYVPSDPKLYVAPGSDDDQDESFGFPEVSADTQRLFIAVEIPRGLKREFSELARSFRPREHDRVRWIHEDAMHLTLKFLGDTPVDKIPDIKTVLERAAESSGKFMIKIGRTGCFPSFVDPRILWVGFSGELRRLEQLQGRVEGGIVALGLEADDRRFRGHITVGRTRPGIRGRFAEDVGLSWQHAPLRSTNKLLPVNAIALYRSYINDNDDTQYQQLGNWELA